MTYDRYDNRYSRYRDDDPLARHGRARSSQSQPIRPLSDWPRPSRTHPADPRWQQQQQKRPSRDTSAYAPERYRHTPTPAPPKRGKRLISLVVIAAVALAATVVVFAFAQNLPTTITYNGQQLEVGGTRTLAEAIEAAGHQPTPGDLVAVDGGVLEPGKGEPFTATVNGEATSDPARKLTTGDVVEVSDGGPREEPAEVAQVPIPWSVVQEGNGAIHLIEGQGTDGVKSTKTGSISGLVIEEITQEPSNLVRRNVTPDVGDDKVLALTFDDGPWSDQTGALLDVLAQHGVKATFFTVGNRIDGEGIDLVKRAASEGHQICTHSFDHASGSGQGVNLGYMTPEEQVAEIQNGYAAIEAATGSEASRVVRTPGGNFGDDVVQTIGPLISAEIGWNIDSQDWQRPGVDAIASQLESAWPGAIVLMHDGGGDRSQTIEALKRTLPRLKEQGYRFVTIDELMQYPLA